MTSEEPRQPTVIELWTLVHEQRAPFLLRATSRVLIWVCAP